MPEGPLAGIPLLGNLPPLRGVRVLVRVDFNVPIFDDGGTRQIEDDFRIRAALPTLRWLTSRGAEVTTCTHLGRPKGAPDGRYDVDVVRERLGELAPGVELLDNLRFDHGEEANDPAFVDRLVEGFSCYVNDAFGASHRSHASIVGPPPRIPSAAGLLVEREVRALGTLLTDPARPFVAVVGGSKVADKVGVMRALLERVDHLIVGGAMAYTFLAAQGHSIGTSLVDESRLDECAALLKEADDRIVLPVDTVALAPGGSLGHGSDGTGAVAVVGADVPDGHMGVDIGPDSASRDAEVLRDAMTIFWNGPMGVFEDDRFASGTEAIAHAVSEASAFSVVGGGDSVAALDRLGLADRVSFVSTGGGASLELLEYGDLPGLKALRRAPNAP
ncbi:MAG: phosphoglycerate kinase [Acidimicrobiales bacterium]